jgi:hypothetical protein
VSPTLLCENRHLGLSWSKNIKNCSSTRIITTKSVWKIKLVKPTNLEGNVAIRNTGCNQRPSQRCYKPIILLRVIPILAKYFSIVSDISSGNMHCMYNIYILYIRWHSFWHILWRYLRFFLTFYLTSILTYFLTYHLKGMQVYIGCVFWHSIWHSFWHTYTLTFFLAFYLACILTFYSATIHLNYRGR